jgi:hypothetical protein
MRLYREIWLGGATSKVNPSGYPDPDKYLSNWLRCASGPRRIDVADLLTTVPPSSRGPVGGARGRSVIVKTVGAMQVRSAALSCAA